MHVYLKVTDACFSLRSFPGGKPKMKKHIFEISHPAAGTPSKALPDGAFTGNGDLTAVLAGSADRVRIHIGKADFWKADGRVYTEHRGGIAPLGLAEILLP